MFRASEQGFLNLINDHVNAQIIVLAHRFPAHNTHIYNHHLILSETSRIFASLRANALDEQSVGEIGADLRMIDNFWFGFAGASLETAIAPIGEYGPLVARSKVDTGRYCLQYLAAANSELANNHINNVIGAGTGVTIISSLEFGMAPPNRTFAFHPRTGPSELQRELASLAQRNAEA